MAGLGNTYPQAGNGQAMEEIDFATDFPDLLPHGRGIQTFEKIAETSLSADAANIDFTSISGKYRHLMISGSLRSTRAVTEDDLRIRYNSDAANNYDTAWYAVKDTATIVNAGADGPAVSGGYAVITGASGVANAFSPLTIWIPDYANTSRHKGQIVLGGVVSGTGVAGDIWTQESSSRWRNTAAISTVTLVPGANNIASGSRATLYGIRTHKFLVDQDDTLVENLVAYWKLDEASGTRVDSWGANHLSDIATVTSNPGRYGIAGQFTAATSEYLSVADNAALSTGDIDFSFALWIYLDTLSSPDEQYVLKKRQTDGSNDEYSLVVMQSGNGRASFSFRNSDTVEATSFGGLSINTWYFIYVYHDATANELGISINNGAINTVPTTGPGVDGTGDLRIGINHSATPIRPFNGRIDEVGFWKKVLTAQERSDLYNAGYGNTLVKLGST